MFGLDVLFVIKALAGLAVILIVLLLIFVYPAKVKEKRREEVEKKEVIKKQREEVPSLEDILKIVRDKKSSTQMLQTAVEKLVKYHGVIPHKLGIRCHPDFDIYEEIILRICRHPNTTKDIILFLDKNLQKSNPSYVRELNDALTKGLNLRGL